MITLENLKAWGADVGDGMARCMNNEGFYLRLVGMAMNETGFEELADALAKKDLKAAFEAAHKLKGVLANLALTPILKPTSELTELLRNETPGDYGAYLGEILKQRDILKAL